MFHARMCLKFSCILILCHTIPTFNNFEEAFSRNIFYSFQPFPKQQILDSSKLKEFADDNFQFYEYGRKLYKRVENAVVKGEIALSSFSFSHSVLKKFCAAYMYKQGLVWERVKQNLKS